MTILLTHPCNGTVGTAATAAGEGFTKIVGTLTYVSGGVFGGSALEAASGQNWFGQDNNGAAFAGFYFRIPTISTATCIGRAVVSGGASLAGIIVNSDGTVSLASGTTTEVATSTTVLSAGAWYRLEWNVTATGTQTARLFYPATSSNPIETLTGATASASAVYAWYYGKGAPTLTADTVDLDTIVLADAWPNMGVSTKTGSGSGAVAWSGTASGARPSSGSAAGAFTFHGSAIGGAAHTGHGSGGFAFAGSATGATTHMGTSPAGITWSGTATGTAPTVGDKSGGAAGAITWTGTATGTAPTIATKTGTAAGGIVWSGLATGTAPNVGGHSGSAAGSIGWRGQASGTTTRTGNHAGAITWAGVAHGVTARAGNAAGQLTWAGAARGTSGSVGEPVAHPALTLTPADSALTITSGTSTLTLAAVDNTLELLP